MTTFKCIIFLSLFFSSFLVRATESTCDAILALRELSSTPDAAANLGFVFRFSKRLMIARYEVNAVKQHYIRKDGPGGWERQRGPAEVRVERDYSATEIRALLEESRRLSLPLEEVIRRFVEVETNFRFPIFEMGDPPDRVATFPEVMQIIRLAERLNTTPEDLFDDFSNRLTAADRARTDYTQAAIAEILNQY